MATKNIERFTVIGNGNAGAWWAGQSSDTRSLVLLAAVLVVLIGSAGVLTTVLSNGTAPDANPVAVAPAQDGPAAVPYFPSQYVNQAKEIEA